MAEDQPVIHVSTPAVVITVVAVLATVVALAAINTGVAIMLAIFVLIFGGELLEHVKADLGDGSAARFVTESPASDDAEDALEVLRRRYAAGELSDAEFERRLETLVSTETVADVERYVAETQGGDAGGPIEPDPELDLERS